MDLNNGLEAKISREETRTLLMIDLGEVPLPLTRISLQDQTSHMGITVQTMEDHMINAQINHSIETMEIGLKMILLIIRLGTAETMGIFLVLHRFKGETSYKIFHIANQEVINSATLPSADLTIDPRLVIHPTNKSSRKTITRLPLMWFVLPQPTIQLMNCQISAR